MWRRWIHIDLGPTLHWLLLFTPVLSSLASASALLHSRLYLTAPLVHHLNAAMCFPSKFRDSGIITFAILTYSGASIRTYLFRTRYVNFTSSLHNTAVAIAYHHVSYQGQHARYCTIFAGCSVTTINLNWTNKTPNCPLVMSANTLWCSLSLATSSIPCTVRFHPIPIHNVLYTSTCPFVMSANTLYGATVLMCIYDRAWHLLVICSTSAAFIHKGVSTHNKWTGACIQHIMYGLMKSDRAGKMEEVASDREHHKGVSTHNKWTVWVLVFIQSWLWPVMNTRSKWYSTGMLTW